MVRVFTVVNVECVISPPTQSPLHSVSLTFAGSVSEVAFLTAFHFVSAVSMVANRNKKFMLSAYAEPHPVPGFQSPECTNAPEPPSVTMHFGRKEL